jgi:hypothetical protein
MGTIAAEKFPSPNHGDRTGGPADLLLLHYTGMPDHDGALRWLCDPRSQVSCHYFVHEDGRVLSLVAEDRRAWHAGASAWAGESDINSRSIGIEIANVGHPGGLPTIRKCRSRPLSGSAGTSWGVIPSRPTAFSRIRMWRPGGSSIRRALSRGPGWRKPASATGSIRPRSAAGRFFSRAATRGSRSRRCRACLLFTVMHRHHGCISTTGPKTSSPPSSAISVPRRVDGRRRPFHDRDLHRLLTTLP